MRRQDAPRLVVRGIAVAVIALVVAGCGGKHYLAQYQFSGRTLSVVYVEPPSPQLLHGYYDLSVPKTAVQTVMRAGGGVAKEVAARRATARLDSAAQGVDVSERLVQRTLERASRYLGTRPVATPEGADYILEITMRSFGIDARSSTAAYLYTSAEAVLLDRHTGREIWSVRVRGSDRLTPWVHGTGNIPSSIITAGTLSTVTVEDFEEALDQLATYSSNLITAELRDKLRDVRDR
jgi:hypothetical protein